MSPQKSKWHLWVMALLYTAAGINHFLNPGFYMAIMPKYIGWHLLLVQLSGAAEILLGLLLIPRPTRQMAAWGIILLLIAVFPANIQMMLNYYDRHLPYRWITVLRLPIQLLLIWWAYTYTKKDKR